MSYIVSIEKLLLTPLGVAEADFMLIQNSPDFFTEYQCWILETGEVWWFPQPLVRQVVALSAPNRETPSEMILSESLFQKYYKHILRHKLSPFYEKALKFSTEKK